MKYTYLFHRQSIENFPIEHNNMKFLIFGMIAVAGAIPDPARMFAPEQPIASAMGRMPVRFILFKERKLFYISQKKLYLYGNLRKILSSTFI